MWAASAGTIAYCSRNIRTEMDDRKIPLMGVMGAFIFAAQMINFTIPATGSSGHLGGGLLLAILLGPCAAFLTIASVLAVQAMFFADGGLLALGCNIFNLGVFPAFIAYPLFYRRMVGRTPSSARITVVSIISAVIGLQLGAFGVVMETVSSGISSLPFTTFVSLMQPIHLGIGIVEGIVTASVVSFIYKARPELVDDSLLRAAGNVRSIRPVLLTLLTVALLTGGVLSWYASEHPDGLEWSIEKITGKAEVGGQMSALHGALENVQKRSALLPDYSFKKPEAHGEIPVSQNSAVDRKRLGTSVSGLLGGVITLLTAGLIGFVLKKRSRNKQL
jgi:cobalt/nickel transport system permease protein